MSDAEERAVKKYELERIEVRVSNSEKTSDRIEKKIDQLISIVQSLPTAQQIDDKIALVKNELQNEIKNAVEKQDLKYAPSIRDTKRLMWALVTTGLGLIGSLILLVLGAFSK